MYKEQLKDRLKKAKDNFHKVLQEVSGSHSPEAQQKLKDAREELKDANDDYNDYMQGNKEEPSNDHKTFLNEPPTFSPEEKIDVCPQCFTENLNWEKLSRKQARKQKKDQSVPYCVKCRKNMVEMTREEISVLKIAKYSKNPS